LPRCARNDDVGVWIATAYGLAMTLRAVIANIVKQSSI
jgi:hypothetical protein